MFSRDFDKAAVAPVGTALRADAAMAAGLPVRPHDHRAAAAVVQRVGFQCGIGAEKCFVGVRYIGILTLETATHPNLATAGLAADINLRVVSHRHAFAQHVHGSALGTGCIATGQHLRVAVDTRIPQGAQHHFAALPVSRNGLNQPAVFERTGKDANCIAFE